MSPEYTRPRDGSEQPPKDPRLVIGLAVGFVLLVLVAFVAGRCTSPTPPPTIVVEGIDAGPGDQAAAAELDADVRAEDERLARLERQHEADVAAMTEADRAEYEQTRTQGRDALARWFKDRTLRLLDAGTR